MHSPENLQTIDRFFHEYLCIHISSQRYDEYKRIDLLLYSLEVIIIVTYANLFIINWFSTKMKKNN